MNINTKQWTTVSPLPQKQTELSAIVCGDTFYLAGGIDIGYKSSKSIFACSLTDLLTSSNSLGSKIRRNFLKVKMSGKKLVVYQYIIQSTLASFNGQLLAIGGWDDSLNYTTNVYRYDSHTNSWNVISQMKNERSKCLAVTLHEDHFMVVGGYNTRGINTTDSVEILE